MSSNVFRTSYVSSSTSSFFKGIYTNGGTGSSSVSCKHSTTRTVKPIHCLNNNSYLRKICNTRQIQTNPFHSLSAAACETGHNCFHESNRHCIHNKCHERSNFNSISRRVVCRSSSTETRTDASVSPDSETKKSVELPTSDEDEELLKIRHTSAHVLAQAVQRLYPEVKVTIGPWIERGFYYDFDTSQSKSLSGDGKPRNGVENGKGKGSSTDIKESNSSETPGSFSPKDLKKIMKEMRRIIKKDYKLIREEVSRAEAERRIREINEPYKLEILESIKTEPITIWHTGDDWWDLCAGPHVESTGMLNPDAIELEDVAGAYWRGDEKRPMLQRIYGTAWKSHEQLMAYKLMKEEAARRDHRKLGSELQLFSIQQEMAGSGLVFWHPKGARIRNIIENYWIDLHLKRGYELVNSPHIAKIDLWKTSGHYDFYGENMYDRMKVEDETYQLKPMNCPFHIAIFQDHLKSYRELPMRLAELGTVYRYERSGTMHGLFRVRGFTQDDAHVFCTPTQIQDEIVKVLNLTEEILTTFGFTDYEVFLSTKPEKSVGGDAIWELSEAALTNALTKKGWEFGLDEGGGAFYGPKIDLKIRDAIGRKWQCSTVQLDFNLPERFNLEYMDSEGSRQRPIMIHRAIFGSVERFFGILVENFAGAFPLWLAPVQFRLLPVADRHREWCASVIEQMQQQGIRADISQEGLRLGKAIRNAETAKVPIMAVVGDKELETGALAVRTHGGNDLGTIQIDVLKGMIAKANALRMFDLNL